MRIYYARPIFTPGERDYNTHIEAMIDELGIERPHWGGKRDENDPRPRAKRVYDSCLAGIAPANAVLAVLSGAEADDGTSSEIGVFYAMMETDPAKKGIIGLLDDWRTNVDDEHLQGKGLNDLLLGCIQRGGLLVHTPEDAMEQLKVWRGELEAQGARHGEDTDPSPPGPSPAPATASAEAPPLRVYFAGPQYTPYARAFVAEHAQLLRDEGMEVYVPRERVRVEPPLLSPEEVFDRDYAALQGCQAMVALLDGAQPGDATALELGFFHGLQLADARKLGIVGWMTDSRGLRRKDYGYGCNHFPVGLIEESGAIVESFDKVLNQLSAWRYRSA
jgi:nucleoside 2-deoxyribosyltransferase